MTGDYGVACCDCRDASAVLRLLGGRKVNLVITSPPYASQRAYDPSSGFRPVPPDDYVAWYKDVAGVVEQILAPDGSYMLLCGEPHNKNIKAHADEGERSLYVMDLVLQHRRQSLSLPRGPAPAAAWVPGRAAGGLVNAPRAPELCPAQ